MGTLRSWAASSQATAHQPGYASCTKQPIPNPRWMWSHDAAVPGSWEHQGLGLHGSPELTCPHPTGLGCPATCAPPALGTATDHSAAQGHQGQDEKRGMDTGDAEVGAGLQGRVWPSPLFVGSTEQVGPCWPQSRAFQTDHCVVRIREAKATWCQLGLQVLVMKLRTPVHRPQCTWLHTMGVDPHWVGALHAAWDLCLPTGAPGEQEGTRQTAFPGASS